MRGNLDLEAIYLRLPVPLQNAAVHWESTRLQRRRYAPPYERVERAYLDRDGWPRDRMRAHQRRRLRAFLQEAALTPFWRARFQAHGLDPAAADPFRELAKLPILEKGEVQGEPGALRHPTWTDDRVNPCHTSGTTGAGLIFFQNRDAEMEQWAVWWRYRARHGIDRGTWCGYFGGRSLVPLGQRRPPFWRWNRPARQLMFSAYHLGPDTAAAYLDALRAHDLPWLHGYPSTLSLLAGYALDQGLPPLPALRVITTGAESLSPRQRAAIRSAFGVPVHDHYGQAEAVANVSECEEGWLHVDEDFSYVELLPIAGADGAHRIVGTNWTNPAVPLLRYDTGDLATLGPAACPCGRAGRVVEAIDGRREDFVVLPSGAQVGRLDHIFKDLTHIREAQIHQPERGTLVLRVVKGAGYDEAGEEARLLAEARKRLGEDLHLVVEYPRQLPRSRAGKLRFVVSDLTPEADP